MIVRKYKNGKLVHDTLVSPDRSTTKISPSRVRVPIKKKTTKKTTRKKKGCGCGKK